MIGGQRAYLVYMNDNEAEEVTLDLMGEERFPTAAGADQGWSDDVNALNALLNGGVYRNAAGQTITVHPKSGLGDVVAEVGDHIISAECKGGIINTRHPGQVSRLYKGLCETVGMLMATPSPGRQVAVVPLTEGTRRLAERLAPRCALAGIEIALVGDRGEVMDVKPAGDNERVTGRRGE